MWIVKLDLKIFFLRKVVFKIYKRLGDTFEEVTLVSDEELFDPVAWLKGALCTYLVHTSAATYV